MRRNSVCVLCLWAVSTAALMLAAFQLGQWMAPVSDRPSSSVQMPLQTTKVHLETSVKRSVENKANHEALHYLPSRGAHSNDQLDPGDTQSKRKHCNDILMKECCNKTFKNSGQSHSEKKTDESQVGHKGGYMLSFRYYEQQTQATRNLLQMQCFANSVGMRIVEPFVIKSMFSTPISEVTSMEKLTQKYLTLTDLMDTEHWNMEAAMKFGYPSIAAWEEFLLKAPRKVVAHCIRYRNPPNIVVPSPGFNFGKGCPDSCFEKFTKSMEYLSAFGFQLVRRTCSNFVDYAGSVRHETFFENALGKYSSSEVTLLVNEFRGFFGLYRLPIASDCGIIHHKNSNISALPSVKITNDALKYSTDMFQGRPYIAVLARIERAIVHKNSNVSSCNREVLQTLKDLQMSHGVSDTFLAMDVGKFGSIGSAHKQLQPYGKALLNSIYGNQWSFDSWEESFEKYSSSDNPAYVANLQKSIAARGRCLILMGGGGFQIETKSLYKRLHPDPNSWCVHSMCG